MFDLTPREGNGGVGFDVKLSPSGDWCNYYRLPEGLDTTDANREAQYTGYEPPFPLISYQEANKHESVCQADGTDWGYEIRSSGSGSHPAFGMQHYVSLSGQGNNDRPWSSAFGIPSLSISVEANPHLLETYGKKYKNGHGYVCPILKDVSTGNYIEYCLEEWSTYGTPPLEEKVYECNSLGGNNIDTIWGTFRSGASLDTIDPGTQSTFEFEFPGWKHFGATITTANLETAIHDVRQTCNNRAHSSSASEYALVGIENGLEIEGEASLLGGSDRNLQVSTEYSPPPSATTEPASEIHDTSAKLNGYVNPNGTDTHYYFEYGPTTSYGTKIPAEPGMDLGSGTSQIDTWNVVSGLMPASIYHFRVVAKNARGEVAVGIDRTFITNEDPPGSAALYRPSSGDMHYFYRGAGGEIRDDWMSASNNEWHTAYPGGSPASEPSAVYRSSNGDLHVYYRAASGEIDDDWMSASNNEWHTSYLGGAAVGDPSGLYDPANGGLYAFFRGTNGQIWTDWMSASNSEWHTSDLGGSAVGNPAAVYRSSNGDLHVFFRTTNGEIDDEWMSASNGEWHTAYLGGSAVSDPSALYDPANGGLYAFFRGTNGQIWTDWMSASNSEWHTSDLGGSAVGNPAAVYRSSNGDLHVFFRTTNGEIDDEWMSASNNEWHTSDRGGVAVGDPSAIYCSGNEDLDVFFRTTGGEIDDDWMSASNGEWHTSYLGGAALTDASVASEPSSQALYRTSDGDLHYFFMSLGEIHDEWMSASNNEWHASFLGGAAVSKPSAVYRSSNGDLHVFFRTSSGEIDDEWMSASNSEWHTSYLGGTALAVAVGDPSGLYDPLNGDLYAFFRTASGQIWVDWMSQSNGEWHTSYLGGAAVSDPSAVYRSSNGNMHVFFRVANGEIDDEWMSASNNEWHTSDRGGVAVGDPSALYRSSNGDLHTIFEAANNQIDDDWMSASTNEWHTSDLG